MSYWSEGSRIAGWWRTPSRGEGPWPAIVQGPGWFGVKDAGVYRRYHEYLTAHGYGVLVIDYRGFGGSGGSVGHFSPDDQLTDLMNAVTFLQSRSDVAEERIGALGTGATGGGNIVMLAAADRRVGAAVAQFPIADGGRWLREMRSGDEWDAFERRLAEDRAVRVTSGRGELVDPHREIMLAPAEREERRFKSEIRHMVPRLASLAAADATLRYRPIDVAGRVITPFLFIAVEGDEATPESHAMELHEAVQGPKQLLIQTGTTHYASYEERAEVVMSEVAAWFARHLGGMS